MNAGDLSGLYSNRFAADQLARKNAIWQVICDRYLKRFITPGDTVIDVACGYGEFLNNIKAQRKIALDLNVEVKCHLNTEIEFHGCSATKLGMVTCCNADVVFASNFLEHLPDKKTLDELLFQVMAALKPGGKFIILGPNLRYLPGQYWDYYDHHLGLTHLSLIEILQLRGFSIELCVDRFIPYTTKGGLPTHPLLVAIYLKLPVLWKVFGKQFFIVARKKQ